VIVGLQDLGDHHTDMSGDLEKATVASTTPPRRGVHNVVLFGAGASFDAGIPLLNSFVDKMWEYAIRGKARGVALSSADQELLSRANDIRLELERFNSRAYFDGRNLENILSLLAFEALAGESSAQKYEALVRAVGRTIELSCEIPHEQKPTPAIDAAHNYWLFWIALLGGHLRGTFPALITFNYDLVFERTLWRFFHLLREGSAKPNVKSCRLNYSFGQNSCAFKMVDYTVNLEAARHGFEAQAGFKAEVICDRTAPVEVEIPYLKLHGSLNWHRNRPEGWPTSLPMEAVDNPLILPPVFNKMDAKTVDGIWKTALDCLREAKHIIIVGYSLPRTDIYMQYFLKAAVGPNSNLQNIFVFDPLLFQDGNDSLEMQKRYKECFAPQFTNRISFRPLANYSPGPAHNGTFFHFVHALERAPDALLFSP